MPKKKTTAKPAAKKTATKKPVAAQKPKSKAPAAKKTAKKVVKKVVKKTAAPKKASVKKIAKPAVNKALAKKVVKKVAKKATQKIVKKTVKKAAKKVVVPFVRVPRTLKVTTPKRGVPKPEPHQTAGLQHYAETLKQALAVKQPPGPQLELLLRPEYNEGGRVSKDAERLRGVARKVH